MEKQNIKLQRINSDIYRIIAEFIGERVLRADVVDVKTGADLSECKVFETSELEVLEKSASYLRSEIAKRLNLKHTPKLRFILDKGRENAARVEELLDVIARSEVTRQSSDK